MVPGKISDLHVEQGVPDDYVVTFVLDSGETLVARGRDVYDPPKPFSDGAEVFGFLLFQNTPAELVYRELDRVDPGWEARFAARREAYPSKQRERLKEQDRRAAMRAEFRESRGKSS
jgi:hypothetical protein